MIAKCHLQHRYINLPSNRMSLITDLLPNWYDNRSFMRLLLNNIFTRWFLPNMGLWEVGTLSQIWIWSLIFLLRCCTGTDFSLFGFNSNLLRWIRNYLTNRKLYVKIGSIYLSEVYIHSGISHGSHLLFILFINSF